MGDKIIVSNQVSVSGEIISDFQFSHRILGEGFYESNLRITRNSGVNDIIPFTVSDRLINVNADHIGRRVEIDGQFRSCNRYEEDKSHLVLFVFTKEINFVDDADDTSAINQISLDGYLCTEPVYRKTPLGREVTDFLIAVNRSYGKSDYIPCICWSRNARFVSHLAIGQHIHVAGRIQSRFYIKKVSEEKYERKMAYEVSCSAVDLIDERGDE